MKTKKLFLMAAVLLSSVSAFAQSGNNEPLKGDVNEDGTVDVADITAVIKIMKDGGGTEGEKTYYWYVGYDQDAYEKTESFKDKMYTSKNNSTPTQYNRNSDGLDISGTGTKPNYLIMILPTTWTVPIIWSETKDAKVGMTLEKQNVSIIGLTGTYNVWSGTGEISDSKIYITIQEKAYYWYVGTSPTKPNNLPYIDSQFASGNQEGWRMIGTSIPNGVIYDAVATPIQFNIDTFYWMIVPTGVSILDSFGGVMTQASQGVFEQDGEWGPDTTTLPGYTIWSSTGSSSQFIGYIQK